MTQIVKNSIDLSRLGVIFVSPIIGLTKSMMDVFNPIVERGATVIGVDIFDGADVLTFLRIEAETWQWEIFEAPNGTMGGDVLNMEYGLVTYRDNGAPWTGDADFDQMYREEWKKENKNTHFYLYNLFTKKQTLLETFNDPTYFALPKWLSDTELEYTLPTGEKKIYKVEE